MSRQSDDSNKRDIERRVREKNTPERFGNILNREIGHRGFIQKQIKTVTTVNE